MPDSINKDPNTFDKKNEAIRNEINQSSPSISENKTEQSQLSNFSNTASTDIVVTVIPQKNYTT